MIIMGKDYQEMPAGFEQVSETPTRAIILTDMQGAIVEANQGALAILGFTSKADLLGKNIADLIVPDQRHDFQRDLSRVLTEGVISRVDYSLRMPDGREFPVKLEASPLKDADWNTVNIIFDIRNIAVWRQVREAMGVFSFLLNSVSEVLVAWDSDFTITDWNLAAERVYCLKASDTIGRKLQEVIEVVEEYPGQNLERFRRLNDEEIYEAEETHRTKNTEVRLSVRIKAIVQDGLRCGWVAIGTDLTKRRQIARRIITLDAAVASSLNAIAIADLNGNLTYVNDSFLKLWDYQSRAEVLGKAMTDLGSSEEMIKTIVKEIEQGKNWSGELSTRRKDGSTFDVQLSASLATDKTGKPLCMVASFIDITEAKKAQESLRDSQAFIWVLLENSHHPMLVINPDTSIRYANPALEKLTGFAAVELVGKKAPYPWSIPESMPRTRREFRVAMSRGPKWFEELYRTRYGKHFWVEVTSAPVMRDDKLAYYMVSWVDITDRRLIEEELTKERDLQKTYLDTVGVMVATVDSHGKINMVNKKGCEILGYSKKQLVGQNWFNLLVPQRMRTDTRRSFHALMNENVSVARHSEGILVTKSGEERLFAFTNTLTLVPGKKTSQILISGEDTTELRKTQEQLEHSHLLASLGEMTAGIAHEVNNPLGSILLYSELLMATDAPSKLKKDLKIIHDEAKRATKIMTDLLIYGRRTQPKVRRVNLNSLIKKVLAMRRYQHKVQNVTVSTDLGDVPLYVRGDSSQLLQVFMNIILNAEDALREHKGGQIIINAKSSNKWNIISISDNGPGIPPELINQIFYPFFTTKPVGEGTGLGLSICYGIVTAHNGLIRAESNKMGGATFVIELPVVQMKSVKNHNRPKGENKQV